MSGKIDKVRGYHYHVTAGYPYILGGYHGVPETANFDGHGNGAGGAGRPFPLGPPFGPPFGPPPPWGAPGG